MKKKIIFLFFFVILASVAYAKTTTLYNYEDDNSKSGIIFKKSQYTSPENADLFFIGVEDKLEGFEEPYIYADNLDGRISFNENKKCYEIEYSQKYLPIDLKKKYCVITKDGKKFVNLKILELADDWSSIKIEWDIEPDTNKEKIFSNLIFKITTLTILILFIAIFCYLKIKIRKT